MKLNYVNEVPETNSKKENLELVSMLQEFVGSGNPAAEINYDRTKYKSETSFYSVVRTSINRHGIKAKVYIRKGKVYLAKA